jgi:hypothetical protein
MAKLRSQETSQTSSGRVLIIDTKLIYKVELREHHSLSLGKDFPKLVKIWQLC